MVPSMEQLPLLLAKPVKPKPAPLPTAPSGAHTASPPPGRGPGVSGDTVPKPRRELQPANKLWMLQILTPCNPKNPWKSKKDGKQQGISMKK